MDRSDGLPLMLGFFGDIKGEHGGAKSAPSVELLRFFLRPFDFWEVKHTVNNLLRGAAVRIAQNLEPLFPNLDGQRARNAGVV